jgi:hypothetical protein
LSYSVTIFIGRYQVLIEIRIALEPNTLNWSSLLSMKLLSK